MATLSNILVANCGKNGTHEYYCEICDYKCSKKYNWNKHILTQKHASAIASNEYVAKNGKKWWVRKDFDSCLPKRLD